MVFKTELAKNRFNTAPPLAVVGFIHVQKDRNMGTNVDGLEKRGGSRGRRFVAGAGRGGRVCRAVCHGGGGEGKEIREMRKFRIGS
jgi:hypothetical protein